MFAVLAFVQSVLWLSQIADEVVALFQVRLWAHPKGKRPICTPLLLTNADVISAILRCISR